MGDDRIADRKRMDTTSRDRAIWRSTSVRWSLVLALLAFIVGFGCFEKGAKRTEDSALPEMRTTETAAARDATEKGFEIPDLSFAFLTGSFYLDFTARIEGEETRIDNYVMKTPEGSLLNICKGSVKKKVFMYEIEGTGSHYAIVDNDGDGVFESRYDKDDLVRKKREGSLVPKWLL